MVSSWRAVVDVDHKNRHDDGESDKNHDKKQVLSNQRDNLGGRRDDLLDDEKKDSEGHQDGGGERDFFPFIRGKVEDQHC